MALTVTMLGCGTSTGVPVIGCGCPVCTSDHPRNRRSRSSVAVETDRGTLVVDTGPDLRQQALDHGLTRVDAVCFTHAHADHIYGLDDLRIFNYRQGRTIPCYGSAATLERVERSFAYVFDPEEPEGAGKPQLELRAVDAPFRLLGCEVTPVPVLHGSLEVYGYRIGAFAYVTDVSHIPEASFELLDGVEVLILGALRWRPHATHFSVAEAVAAAERIGTRRTVFTHLAHEIDYTRPAAPLPADMELGYDGLVLEIP